MKPFKTLRLRLALWVAGLLIGALITFGGFVYWRVERGMSTSVDDTLALSAAQAVAAVDIKDGQLSFTDSVPQSGSIADALNDRGHTIRVLDNKGDIVQAFGR